jgi:mono/diheme cytochrome c family protein
MMGSLLVPSVSWVYADCTGGVSAHSSGSYAARGLGRLARMTRLAAILVALALPLLVAACGGGDEKSATPESVVGSVPAETSGGGSDAGEAVFKENCATCHTLSAAGASGTVGPNLDDVKPDEETVKTQVENGGGAMPAFKGQLSDQEIDDVSAYVAENAGS